jgi:hypothetical protein
MMGKIPRNSILVLLGTFFLICLVSNLRAFAEEAGKRIIIQRCGKCHGLTLEKRCLTGTCRGGRAHAITPRPWDLVVSWMRAMGCVLTDDEATAVVGYLMRDYGKSYPVQWDRVGTVADGWNVVSMAVFHDHLYAGIEGNGSIFRMDEGPTWKRVLATPNYTVYGLTVYKDKLYAGTNDPAGEIWKSGDGETWERSATLPGEKGIISLGIFNGFLYAGTARGAIYRSADGTAWTEVNRLLQNAESNFSNWVRFLIPQQGVLYAGIERGGIYRTEDGIKWRPIRPTKEKGVRGASVFKGNLYVGTTDTGEIMKLSPGTEGVGATVFTMDPNAGRGYVASMAVFDDSLYAGIGGKVFRTEDGRHWEEIGDLGPYTIEAIKGFQNHLYAGTTLPPSAWIYRMTGKKNGDAATK